MTVWAENSKTIELTTFWHVQELQFEIKFKSKIK